MLQLNIKQVIVISTIIHLIVGFGIPLGNDEVYYLQYARYPSYHYYDHPLMVGLISKIFSFNLHVKHHLFYRLFSIVASSVSTFIIYKTTLLYGTKKQALISSILFSMSFYFSVIAGVFIMPDAPMILFWTLAFYIASYLLFSETIDINQQHELLIWFGILSGCAILCKFHAAYLWIGFFLFILINKRDLFSTWHLYLSMLITAVFLIPIIYWNYKNNWVNFSFYTGRVGLAGHISFQYFVREILGEIFYQNPIVWIFIFIQLAIKKSNASFDKKREFLFLMSFPLLFGFWALSLSRETLPHWSGPAYLPIIILVSTGLQQEFIQGKLNLWMRAMVVMFSVVLVLGIAVINYFPGTIGNKKDMLHYGSGDFTLDMYGWKESSAKMLQAIKGSKLEKVPLVSSAWFPAAHINEYITSGTELRSFALGPVNDIHQFHWINQINGGLPERDSLLYITTSNYFKDPVVLYRHYFNKITLLNKIEEKRNRSTTRFYYLYLLSERTATLKLIQ